jgi:chromosome segregation ATPase
MKIKIGVVILAVVCVGLLIALIATKKAADEQRTTDEATISKFSNELDHASASIDDLNKDNLVLSNYLAASRTAYMDASNSLVETSNNLAETSKTLVIAKTSLQGAEDQITNLNSRITDLESQNKALDVQAGSLSNTIATLDSQIADTKLKLSTSETNNTFLTAELQKQMAQKAELEHRFNDIDDVRAQVKKLRDELFVARRLQWISSGTSPGTQPKGGELLMKRTPPPSASAARSPQYDLNVEVGSDGSVHVIPAATNSPAH